MEDLEAGQTAGKIETAPEKRALSASPGWWSLERKEKEFSNQLAVRQREGKPSRLVLRSQACMLEGGWGANSFRQRVAHMGLEILILRCWWNLRVRMFTAC